MGHGVDAALDYRRVARGVVAASNTRGSRAETAERIDYFVRSSSSHDPSDRP